eukprot:m.257226 g.257226  ORF g.257226 m.257226 type:complete len:540 (-) comp19180_c3_seq4:33-1652(-)
MDELSCSAVIPSLLPQDDDGEAAAAGPGPLAAGEVDHGGVAPRVVHITKGPGGFGFTLHGLRPVKLSGVEELGAAYAAGARLGDRILAINGVEVVHAHHQQVVDAVCACKDGVVTMVLLGISEPRTFAHTTAPITTTGEYVDEYGFFSPPDSLPPSPPRPMGGDGGEGGEGDKDRSVGRNAGQTQDSSAVGAEDGVSDTTAKEGTEASSAVGVGKNDGQDDGAGAGAGASGEGHGVDAAVTNGSTAKHVLDGQKGGRRMAVSPPPTPRVQRDNKRRRRIMEERRRDQQRLPVWVDALQAINAAIAGDAKLWKLPADPPASNESKGESGDSNDFMANPHLDKHVPKTDEFAALLLGGVPHVLRRQVWLRCSGACWLKSEFHLRYDEIVCCGEAELTKNKEAAREIDKDLMRTFPENVFFNDMTAEGTHRLRRLLIAFAWLRPDVGYCQGMGMIAASLILVLEEHEAFWTFYAIRIGAVAYQQQTIALIMLFSGGTFLFVATAHILPEIMHTSSGKLTWTEVLVVTCGVVMPLFINLEHGH